MKKYFPITTFFFSLLFFILSLTPVYASQNTAGYNLIPIKDLSPVYIVDETEQDILAVGCEKSTITENTISIRASADKAYPVMPKDSPVNTVYMCAQQELDFLTVEGRVAGLLADINNWGNPIGWISMGLNSATGGYTPTVGDIADWGWSKTVSPGAEYLGESALFHLLNALSKLGNWLLHMVAGFVGLLLNAQRFITHPFVVSGWPFIQGVANLGFILALLFIAVATTLHLNNFNAQRMLPRLLIAALLINFSLVIGGVLIDASRLLMAILMSTLSGGDQIATLPANLLNSSAIFNNVFASLTAEEGYALERTNDETFALLQATILIWGLLIAFFVLMVGLFMRYIMLILLLIASPLAYLAFALPATGKLATRWWTEFLKYVFYGPVVVFILVLTSGITSGNVGRLFGSTAVDKMENIAVLGVTIAMLIAAASAGKYLGIAGAGAAVNAVKNNSGRVGRWVARNPGKAGLALGVATGGVGVVAAGAGAAGAKALGKGAYHQARDFRKSGGKAATNIWNATGGRGKWNPLKAGTRTKDGDLKPGETSAGDWAGQKLDPKKWEAKERATNDYETQLQPKLGTPAAAGTITHAALRNTEAAKQLKPKEASDLVVNLMDSRDSNRQIAAINNIEIVRQIKDDDKAVDQIFDKGNSEVIKQFNAMVRRIENEDKK